MERAIQRACRLLAETDLPMAGISHLCGIAQKTHLPARLRKRFGMSPSSYRAQLRGT